MYAQSATRHVSIEGYSDSEECLRMRDIARPKPTPRAMDTPNESKKRPVPWNRCDTEKSNPWNLDRVLRTELAGMPTNVEMRLHSLVHDDTDSIVE